MNAKNAKNEKNAKNAMDAKNAKNVTTNHIKTLFLLTAVLMVLPMLFCFTGCGKTAKAGDIWDSALYTQDTELGEGEKTLTVEVQVEEKTVTFTLHTDAETVGAALQENKLIDGEQGEYGLYVKKVNGITADYDVDHSYWGFYINGEMAMSGVDGAAIADGETYRLAYTK